MNCLCVVTMRWIHHCWCTQYNNTTVDLSGFGSTQWDRLDLCGSNTNANGPADQRCAIRACCFICLIHTLEIISLTHACAQADAHFPSFKSPSPAKYKCPLYGGIKMHKSRSTVNNLTIMQRLRIHDSHVNSVSTALRGMRGHFGHARDVLL